MVGSCCIRSPGANTSGGSAALLVRKKERKHVNSLRPRASGRAPDEKQSSPPSFALRLRPRSQTKEEEEVAAMVKIIAGDHLDKSRAETGPLERDLLN